MDTRLFVGNLTFNTTEDEIRKLFEKHGTVSSIRVITNRETGRSRGFAFVEMESAAAAAAMKALNGTDLDGRPLRIDPAKEREERPDRGDRGGDRGDYGRGDRGDRPSRRPY
jgi:RNA recognition motif-containing protein